MSVELGAPTVTMSFDIGIKNLSCCAMRLTDGKCEILEWAVLPLIDKNAKAKNIDMETLSLSIFTVLDDLMERLEGMEPSVDFVDNVLLESQPCMKNPTMKSVQVMIYSYFMMRKHQQGNVGAVHLVFAGAKNNATFHPYTLPAPTKANMKPYELRKWQSVEYTKLYIANDEELVKLFSAHKKTDDIADCFTQACVWHKRNKLHASAFDVVVNHAVSSTQNGRCVE
jgi:hypothetical protein